MPSKTLFVVAPSVLVLVLAGAAHTGCSGSSGTTFPDDGGNASSSGSGSGGGSSGSSSGSGSTGSGGSSGSGSGGSSSGNGSGSSSGSSSSSTGSSSSGSGGTGVCPTSPCGGGEVCCLELDAGKSACEPTCAAADTLACAKRSDCAGGTPECCATLVVNGGMFPSCHSQSLSTQCVASCTSNFSFVCQATETLHLCSQKSDCASDVMNPDCCTVSNYQFCVSDQLATLGNLTCSP